ncbi:MAG: hypothetical protein ACI88G_000786 [Woeseiaceae bacterium]|jgi:hypothetical protein
MSDNLKNQIDRPIAILRRFRMQLLVIVSVVVVYALLGFILAPWLVKRAAIEGVAKNLHGGLMIEAIAINPFVLSLRVDGIQLNDASGDKLAGVDQVFVNFQSSSLFRRAWTFDEVHIVGPELFLARDASGVLNVAGLVKAEADASPQPAAHEEASAPRLLIFDFAIRESIVNWSDQVPVDPVTTYFGPVNIAISELNTLPQRPGQQDVVITTESQGTLSWSGSLQFNPFNSAGRATIRGSHFPLASAYMRHETGLDIVEGSADVGLNYNVVTGADGSLHASIDDFNVIFSDVLVRTFHGTEASAANERDLFALSRIALSGGSMRWPEQELSIESISLSNSLISLYRKENGDLDLGPESSNAAAAPVEADAETESNGSAWRLSLQALNVSEMSVALQDHSVEPVADVGIDSLNLEIRNISNEEGASFPTDLNLVPRAGGEIVLNGDMVLLPQPILDFTVNVISLPLAGMHPYLKPLADVNLDSGALNIAVSIQSSTSDSLLVDGNLDIVDFLITETDEGSRLGSWAKFDVRNFEFSDANNSLKISELLFHQPYGDILIAEDGSINLGRVEKTTGSPETVDDSQQEDVATGEALAVTIGQVLIENAAADFADLSLPLPFAAKISNLNGNISTIVTGSSEPSAVELEGAVDEFGFVRVSGSVTPLDVKLNTDIKVAFQNVEMPKFSAYTIPLAGREIASGKLDLDLGYRVTASELAGENKIILRDLELGDEVAHPDAMSLPLGLAVALLKDADGKIDIDLPVSGNVDDPEFRYGGVVLKALSSLIIKIVASPFALLGNLLGVEASDLEYITFIEGRSDLTPPERERTDKLAEALALRPALLLELGGAIARDADGYALKAMKLDVRLATLVEQMNVQSSGESMFAEQQKLALEQLYSATEEDASPSATLVELRAQFTTAADETAAVDAVAQFDELAYTNELRRRLIELQPIADEELVALANERAASTRDEILQANQELAGRIVISKPQAVEAESTGGIRMKITLRTADDEDLVEDQSGSEL